MYERKRWKADSKEVEGGRCMRGRDGRLTVRKLKEEDV